MKTRIVLILITSYLEAARRGLFIAAASIVLAAYAQAQWNGVTTFDGNVIDLGQWKISTPLGGSTVTQNDALLLTSDGSYGTFCFTPGLFGPGSGIALRKRLLGDFDIQVDFTNFSGPSVDFVSAFFNVYQDQDNQIHIKRIRGYSVDGIQTVARVGGGGLINGNHPFNPVTSGTFRITRSGNVVTTYFNGAPDFAISAFSGPVIISLILLGPEGETASVVYDNFSINSGELVDPLLVCPDDNQPPLATDDFYGMNQSSSLNVPTPGVLANDSDPDEDALTAELVTGPASAASLQFNPDGSFTYTPPPYFCGEDSFTYRAYDGAAYAETATVHITISQPGSQGFITGGGKFFHDGRKCTFGFVAKVQGNGVQGNLEFQDHDIGFDVKASTMDWVYAANQIDGYFSGTCRVNGVGGYSYFVQVHDRGQPGSNDDFAIWVFDSFNNPVYTAGASLAGGNIVIHGN